MKKLILACVLIVAACSSLPYKDDVGFLVSAQAGSAEFPVYINGKLCADMEGLPGLCAKRVKSTEPIRLSFDAQPYPWHITVRCTQGVVVPPPSTVPARQPFVMTINPGDFSSFRSFSCIGEVNPQDRAEPVSAKFEVRFSVVDARYVEREGIFIQEDHGKKYLVLGTHARSSRVFDDGKWKRYSKNTTIEIKGDPSHVRAYSESFAMRFNYFRMTP